MKNTLHDLNNHLFAQLERLSEEELSVEELSKEISRTGAIVNVASQIIDNANTVMKAVALKENGLLRADTKLPTMLEG